jgi:pimeloyl-ACP methyl ester carboxylesterase
VPAPLRGGRRGAAGLRPHLPGAFCTVCGVSTPRFLELPEGVEGRRVDTPVGEFAVLDTGPRGSATVLLVPGWTGSKEDFLPLLPLVAEAGYRAVAVDLRGQFETPGADAAAAYTLDGYGGDVLALAEVLDGRPVHLVGHSFGGLVARSAVLRDPRAVRSLTLLCSGPGAVPPSQHPLLHALADGIAAHGLAATWRVKRAYDRSQGAPEQPPPIEAFLQRRFTANDPESLRAMSLLLTTAPDAVRDLAATDVPVLVATGVGDDGWPVAEQAAMAARLGVDHVLLEGAGHSPAVEQPAPTAGVLCAFWASVDAPGRDLVAAVAT